MSNRFKPVLPRLLAKIDKKMAGFTSPCWLWTGATRRDGYGLIRVKSIYRRAHRVAYEELIGPIPAEMTLDHLCRNRNCVNPDHLDVVTRGENTRRGVSHQALKTHCPQGHEYTSDNTYVSPSRPNARYCISCMRERQREHKRRKRQVREMVESAIGRED